MSSGQGTGPALAHRSVSNIRSTTPGHSPGPSTPPRVISASFGSPAAIRADDDFVLIEIGTRFLSVGFAGDAQPKARLSRTRHSDRRVGDFRQWLGSEESVDESWQIERDIWQYDVRNTDLGVVKDRLEGMLREAFTKYLLIDSKPRRAGLILDSAVPIPLLSTILDILFQYFLTPIVSLMSSATVATIGAGVRSALVINMGWAETTITSVYEYREVKSTRSVRAGQLLLEKLYKVLHKLHSQKDAEEGEPKTISFEDCEDVLYRLMWCRPCGHSSSQRQSTQLDTVVEQDETVPPTPESRGSATVPLPSTTPPASIDVPFDKLADVCDEAFFDSSSTSFSAFDDDELPLHLLIYQHLVQLPIDVRATCMSRITFAGGCSRILGIKQRAVDEVAAMVERRGWTPVSGKTVDQMRNKQRLQRQSNISHVSESSTGASEASDDISASSRPSSIVNSAEVDAIEAKLARNRNVPPPVQGQLRVIHSLGAWSGASLLCHLRVPATATVDRELWLLQGPNGASKPGEVDMKAQTRQSMGAGGLIRGSGGHHTNWTLGAWGST